MIKRANNDNNNSNNSRKKKTHKKSSAQHKTVQTHIRFVYELKHFYSTKRKPHRFLLSLFAHSWPATLHTIFQCFSFLFSFYFLHWLQALATKMKKKKKKYIFPTTFHMGNGCRIFVLVSNEF